MGELDAHTSSRQGPGMEWLVEFEERRLPFAAIWSNDMENLVGPLKSTIDWALSAAASGELEGLKVVLYAEKDDGAGPRWGFKPIGPSYAVDCARRLIGDAAPIGPAVH